MAGLRPTLQCTPNGVGRQAEPLGIRAAGRTRRRIELAMRRDVMLSLADARARILGLAEPADPIEVPLVDAAGLVLAEPLIADVDSPPFDRAAHDGYAVRAVDAHAGAYLRVVGPARGWGGRTRAGQEGRGRKRSKATAALALPTPTAAELAINPGEAAHVTAGAPLPMGADAVVRTEDTRPERGVGAPHTLLVTRGVTEGQNVVARGEYLRAGDPLVPAGSRIRLPMIGLLASQGCVHPVCHRRVRVAVFAVGDHLVGPGEAPVMHRERNGSGPAVVAPCLHWGAIAHDLGAVHERELTATLHRALSASVVVVLGEPEGAIPRALKKAGVRMEFEGVSLHPGKRLSYGVWRDDLDRVQHHVFHLAPGPVGVMAGVALLIGPLIARLQGGPADPPAFLRAVWNGPTHRPTDDRHWAVPVTLAVGEDARLRATPLEHRGKDDLPGFAKAEALAVLPPRDGPWERESVVEVAPLGAWPPGSPAPSAWA
ncbi:MAG: molybdopterin molybdotransferase MoeA [Isosphaeraceae bacterium]